MLKTIYNTLFYNQESDVPTVDEVFSPKENKEEIKSLGPGENFKEYKEMVNEYIVVQKEKPLEAEIVENKTNIVKWIPNDDLVQRYSIASSYVGKIPNLLKKIKFYKDTIALKLSEIHKITGKEEEEINPFDKYNIIDYNEDIYQEQAKIAKIELEIKEAQKFGNDTVFEEYTLYLAEANEFINNNLSGIMNVNDIITSSGIYFKIKYYIDKIKYGRIETSMVDRIKIFPDLFNIADIYKKSKRLDNLSEDNPFLCIFDNLENRELIKPPPVISDQNVASIAADEIDHAQFVPPPDNPSLGQPITLQDLEAWWIKNHLAKNEVT